MNNQTARAVQQVKQEDTYMATFKGLRADEVTFTLSVEQDDVPVREYLYQDTPVRVGP